MTHPPQVPSPGDVEAVHQLLVAYSVDTATYPTEAVIAGWLEQFGPVWVSHAVTEALYQGRYKLVSIDQILKLWQRRGQPIRHFNREFESIILGQSLLLPTGYGEGAGALEDRPPAPAEAAPSSASEDAAAPEHPSGNGDTPETEPAAAIAPAPRSLPLFQPVADTAQDWHHAAAIPPFVPRPVASDLHERLRAVVQAGRQN